jgi:hypothetical protein
MCLTKRLAGLRNGGSDISAVKTTSKTLITYLRVELHRIRRKRCKQSLRIDAVQVGT